MQMVRVTHPFQPLFDQEFVFITVRTVWGPSRVQYYDAARVVRSIPASWTDCGARDAFSVAAAERSALQVDDLPALAALVAALEGGANGDL